MKNIFIILVMLYSVISQSLTTPEYIHAPLLLKVIKDDAAMMKAKSESYNIAIVYDSEEDDSVQNKERMMSFFDEQKIVLGATGINLNTVNVEFKSKARFYASMDNSKIHLIYICSDVEEDVIRQMKFVSEALDILTMSGSEEIYEYGATITVAMNDNDIPQLVIKKDRMQKERKTIALDYLKSTNLTLE